MLALIDDPEIQRKNAGIFMGDKHRKGHVLSKIERYPKHTKIRIGYFSADFKIHPVSDLIVELFEIHDRNRFEIYAFSFGANTNDEINLRIKEGVDHFHDVLTMSHKDVATLARSLELDIAVDLRRIYSKRQNRNICYVSSTNTGLLFGICRHDGYKLHGLSDCRSHSHS